MNKTTNSCRRLLTVLALVVAMVLPAQVWADITPAKPSTGDGSSRNPYQIGNAAELYWFAALVNGKLTDGTAQNLYACAILTSDITVNTGVLKADGSLADDVSGFTSWTPIGTSTTKSFYGTFDGKGHTVSGLYFENASTNFVGLFGISRGNIKNVGVVASYFKGKENVGSVCGSSLGNNCTITNCFSTSTVSGTKYVGGVCGYISNNSITQNFHTGIVSGSYRVGGVCGYLNASTMKDCYHTGSVTATASNGDVGGVIGYMYGSSTSATNCYNAGDVIGSSEYVGEICGQLYSGTVRNCYYLTSTSDNAGGKTAAQFASGEVAWLLNGSQPTGTWGQLLGTDNLPVLDNTNKVYGGYLSCDENEDIRYANTELSETRPAHSFNIHGICSVCSRNQPATYVASSGLYEIGNAGQLAWFGALVNGTLPDGTAQNTAAKGVLTADIDLAPFAHWTPIGNESSKFGGTFDGRGFKVQHMSITRQGSNSGLFGYASGATLQHISIDGNVTLRTTSYTEGYGSIVGRMDNSTVSHCHSSVNFSIDTEMDASAECIGHIGGIVGKMHESASAVKGCSYSGTINLGNKKVKVAAGIAGYAINSEVPITDCRFTGTIHSGYEGKLIMGGIFGYTRTSGNLKVTNCLQAGVLEKAGDKSLSGILIGQINNGYGANAVQNNYYAHDGLNVIGSTKDTPATSPATLCTTEQLAGGEVTWLLNGKQPTGAWGQLLGTDDLPVLDNTNQVLACALDATNATYWLTYSNLTADAALSVPDDRTLLVCNAQVKKGVLTLTERDDNLVAQGEGVLVKTDAPYLNAMPHTGSALTPAAENDLVATPAEAQTIVADAGYTLYRLTYSNATTKEGLGFYLGVSGSSKDGSRLKATPGKAYLNVLTSEATAPASSSPAMGFRFADNNGETTGLRGISATDGTTGAPAATYDLTGRKVSRPVHGLYIQNGKKVIIK